MTKIKLRFMLIVLSALGVILTDNVNIMEGSRKWKVFSSIKKDIEVLEQDIKDLINKEGD